MERTASGPEVTDDRGASRLAQHLRWLAWLVDPGFPGKPFVAGATDRAVGTREEHRTASKLFPVRFHARRDRASRLGAFDHDDAHLGLLPVIFSRVCPPSAGLHLFSREALVPADPGGLQKFDSGGFLQDSGEVPLDRLGRLGRDFLSELPKFPVLRGRGFEILAALRG